MNKNLELSDFLIKYFNDKQVFESYEIDPKISGRVDLISIHSYDFRITIADYVEFSWDGDNTKIQVKIEDAWNKDTLEAVVLLYERWSSQT